MLSTPRSLGFVLAAILGAMLVPGCRPDEGLSGPSESPSALSPQLSSSRRIPDQYIIVFKSGLPDPATAARSLVAQHGGTLRFTYTGAMQGFAARLPAQAIEALQRNPHVSLVEQDAAISTAELEPSASWGLDRIDQRSLPLNLTYGYEATGAGVSAYILDTGIRTDHLDFGGRASVAYDVIGDGMNGQDCRGHGTHVAGIVGGTRYGVAKQVRLYSVRVLDCTGSGTFSGLIAGLDWVVRNGSRPAVANMSLSGSSSSSVTSAIQAATQAGVTVVVAAGNAAADACSYSPASAPAALTVGASNSSDAQASFSNSGRCVDLYAPGQSIRSDHSATDTAWASYSGTSQASPHVAGAAALYLQSHPAATPAEVGQAIIGAATSGAVTGLGSGSPNLLLYSGLGAAEPVPTPTPEPDPTPPPPPPPTVDLSPTASLSVSCPKGPCSFNGGASTDDKGIMSYRWEFGDGTTETTTVPQTTHRYSARGKYPTRLTVTDAAGQSATATASANVRKL